MNQRPSASLVAQVQEVILATFEISSECAQEHACGLAGLAEGWGGEGAQHLDWAYAVKKRLGDTLPWRSDAERKSFYSERDLVVRSYERYIQQNKRTS